MRTAWAYFTAVLDCFDRSILGWTFTPRCRALDVVVALEQAHAVAYPHLVDLEREVTVVLRHDNGTQFTAWRYRDTATTLGV